MKQHLVEEEYYFLFRRLHDLKELTLRSNPQELSYEIDRYHDSYMEFMEQGMRLILADTVKVLICRPFWKP